MSEGGTEMRNHLAIDARRDCFPFCIVWTPIPLLTWLCPFIGHMGIATSKGVIRDFAGPYTVGEGNMAFGRPVKYWKLQPSRVPGGEENWDAGVKEASDIYKNRMHNLFCDNCHSHVATALNLMSYNDSQSWNMVKLCVLLSIYSRYVSWAAVFKTWTPSLLLLIFILLLITVSQS
ncbi:unnamed protein product [Notodromas monacha]|uniref:Transmembrane protein 222 n=1 Tax=Notodromas monacha TaxID=399045 RepID=A0A7R9BQQ6_9CRUS|nr:unnamed protein product [Notodromas monacha]CAG0919950.1 unnamed protein product [Notodromas monacha]